MFWFIFTKQTQSLRKINNIEQAFAQMSYRLENGKYEPTIYDYWEEVKKEISIL